MRNKMNLRAGDIVGGRIITTKEATLIENFPGNGGNLTAEEFAGGLLYEFSFANSSAWIIDRVTHILTDDNAVQSKFYDKELRMETLDIIKDALCHPEADGVRSSIEKLAKIPSSVN